MRISVVYGYLLMTAMTFVYCILAWYGANLWAMFLTEQTEIPLFTLIFIKPLPVSFWWGMIHWQLVAFLSLAICIWWGLKRSNGSNGEDGAALPIVLHTAWILFAICCHLLAAVMPMVGIGYSLQ